ncbi:hypothetical protein G6F40_015906 [Rhizopus arrhizus]|nr:hypothetical protein G6F40_015906 [Rhizopus arrhizus]
MIEAGSTTASRSRVRRSSVCQVVVGGKTDGAFDAVAAALVVEQGPAPIVLPVVELVDVVRGGAAGKAQYAGVVGGEGCPLHRRARDQHAAAGENKPRRPAGDPSRCRGGGVVHHRSNLMPWASGSESE